MSLDLKDIYKILSDVTERNNDTLQTFAALKFTEQFNDVALGKGAFYENGTNDGLFYSKAWNDAGNPTNKTKIDYPALIAFSNTTRTGVNFNPLYNVELYTCNLDTKDVKAWELLMNDLDRYLITIVRELQKYVYITSDQTSGWYHLDLVNTNEGDGTWTNVVRDGWLKERLKSRTLNLRRGYSETPKNLLTVGTSIEIQGCF